MLLSAIPLLLLAHLQPLLSSQPKHQALCIERVCYTLFWSPKRFQGASKMCEQLGGHLMTVRSSVAADAISHMMGAVGSGGPVLWIGLQLQRGCTDPGKRLRGFQWVTGDEQSDYMNWAGNGTTCEPRCVTVLEDRSWHETDCSRKADGFLCEFTYAATCSPVAVTPAKTVLYNNTPFGVDGVDFLAVPPGTRATVPSLELELTCTEVREDVARWSRDAAGAWDCRAEGGGCAHACHDSRCSCPDGQRLGADGRSCSPPPGPCEPSPCQHLCFAHEGSVSCMCHDGFELAEDGRTCRDVDDCALVPSVCEQDCRNLLGSFSCHCFPGYEDVDGKCEDVDECAAVQSPCAQDCNNTPGGFQCLCGEPYVPDPEDPEKCKLVCNTTECPAVCKDSFINMDCQCPDGYVLDDDGSSSPMCVDIDDCDSVTCDYECLNLLGSYECRCPPGQLLQADRTSCKPEGYDATDVFEHSTAAPPVTTAAPPLMDNFALGILLGVAVGVLLMLFLLGLLYCLLRKRYAAHRALDCKGDSGEKEVALQKVTADCP